MISENNQKIEKAVLVGIQLPKVTQSELESSLQELTRLVTTLGYQVVGQVTQKRSSDKSALILGEGKLKILAQWTGGSGILKPNFERKKSKAALKWEEEEKESETIDESENNIDNEFVLDGKSEETDFSEATDELNQIKDQAHVVIVDCDLSPSQLRNLENISGVKVLDRTGVIIEIFSRHAKTKAAKLQVEIARLTYVAPRLRESTQSSERQGGGIGGKGSGETSLELDKRKIRDRIKELKAELSAIGNEHEVRRARRSQEITVALVGYTNAGKSSLMRALTGSDILVADKLFATLDTTIRPLYPESIPKILISDTVGFIKKLPHDLVASFKSTLDEALHASLLLYVVDSSDASFRSQLEVTQKVLSEVGATDVPYLLILNKRDNLSFDQQTDLQNEFPHAFLLSTRDPEDLKKLRQKVLSYFETDMIDAEIFIPYQVQGLIGEVRSKSRVLSESYNENGLTLKVRAHADTIVHFNKKLKAPLKS